MCKHFIKIYWCFFLVTRSCNLRKRICMIDHAADENLWQCNYVIAINFLTLRVEFFTLFLQRQEKLHKKSRNCSPSVRVKHVECEIWLTPLKFFSAKLKWKSLVRLGKYLTRFSEKWRTSEVITDMQCHVRLPSILGISVPCRLIGGWRKRFLRYLGTMADRTVKK